jgi:hypothetical protein
MKLFHRKHTGTDQEQRQGKYIADHCGFPKTAAELLAGAHSYERIFSFTRKVGYKSVHDSIDTYKIVSREKDCLVKKCREAGILPIFKDDYITLESFPRRNVIKEEILNVRSCHGVKTIEKRVFFDILHYISV